ncbi:MAG: hypothetical protein AB9836_04640 [Aminipila sp.]
MNTIYKVTIDLNKNFNKPIVEEYPIIAEKKAVGKIICDGGSECHKLKEFNLKWLGKVLRKRDLEFCCLIESDLEYEDFIKSYQFDLIIQSIFKSLQDEINLQQTRLDATMSFYKNKNLRKSVGSKDIAKKLDGRQYGAEITKEEEKLVKELGLVVAFGASDDLMEFRGAIDDEAGCFDGGIVNIDKTGAINADADDQKLKYSIEALWCDGQYTWSYKTDIPHETFSIYEDDKKYCLGIVFSINDLIKVE